MRKYRGIDCNSRPMLAAVYGEMNDGSLVYVECDQAGNWIDEDAQYIRSLYKVNGRTLQVFIRL